MNPIELTQQERDNAFNHAEEASQRQDLKSHCTKICDGIEKLDQNSGDRAIWELIQNACDLGDNINIKIRITSNSFSFSHDGKPFSFDALCSLVKQVSSQEKENDETVGQYGTGFLTTHAFSRKFTIWGSLKIKDGVFVDIDNFEIDRDFDIMNDFIKKMSNQINKAKALIKDGEPKCKRDYTIFTYSLSSESFEVASRAVNAAKQLMPYVMTFSDNLVKCFITDIDNTCTTFSREIILDQDGLHVMRIKISNGVDSWNQDCFYLQSEDEREKVILPLKRIKETCLFESLPKLFIYYPLLGTETWGTNFIFHSSFYPKEERNGILLPSTNPNIKTKANANMNCLSRMASMVFDYLDGHIEDTKGAIEYAKATINPSVFEDEITQKAIEDYRSIVINRLKDLKMVLCSDSNYHSVNESCIKFFDSNIIEILNSESGMEFYDTIYHYSSSVYLMPVKAECLNWSKIIHEWNLDDCYSFINIEDVAKTVSTVNNGNLHNLLEFIKKMGKDSLFSDNALIPNREGIKHKVNNLRNGSVISKQLYDIARPLISEQMDSLVDTTYADITELVIFGLKEYQSAISNVLTVASTALDSGTVFSDDFIKNLRIYCCAFPEGSKASNRSNIMRNICLINNEVYQENIILGLPSGDPDLFDTAFQILLKGEMYNISLKNKEWVDNSFQKLNDFIASVANIKDEKFRARFFPVYGIFPNKNHILCKKESLWSDEGIDELLFVFYQEACGMDLKEELVDDNFKAFEDFKKRTPKSVANEIEDALKRDGYTNSVTIDIIEALDRQEDKWKDLFEVISSKKAEIFLKRVPKENKESVYKLMKIDDNNKLNDLVELSENPDMHSIVEKAKAMLKEERDKVESFNKKAEIGKHIEDKLREKMKSDLTNKLSIDTKPKMNEDWEIDDIQNGQDVVISINNKPVYYIEIKAKWTFNVEPAHMSRNQMKMAIRHPDCYSLCCVDLTKEVDNYFPEIDTIINNTHVHLHIANEIRDIMSGIISAEDKFALENEEQRGITMGGDYRCNIPKRIFVNGTPFDNLINVIIEKINKEDNVDIASIKSLSEA